MPHLYTVRSSTSKGTEREIETERKREREREWEGEKEKGARARESERENRQKDKNITETTSDEHKKRWPVNNWAPRAQLRKQAKQGHRKQQPMKSKQLQNKTTRDYIHIYT